jgi:hypothetical protein
MPILFQQPSQSSIEGDCNLPGSAPVTRTTVANPSSDSSHRASQGLVTPQAALLLERCTVLKLDVVRAAHGVWVLARCSEKWALWLSSVC